MRPARFGIVLLVLLVLPVTACQKQPGPAAGPKKLMVVTTLFPLYDFTRTVGGDRVEVRLLLPPGVEPHHFEPRPEDIVLLGKADVFIYTNRYLEPWAAGMIEGFGGKGPEVVDASAGVAFLPAAGLDDDHGGSGHGAHHGEGMDPHVWLSVPNAAKMVDNITAALARKDPAGSDFYRRNADEYRTRLAALDSRFRAGLAGCGSRIFLHGGHYAFGYLAQRYGLTYLSAYGVSADAEPTPRKMMALVDQVRKHALAYIFYEELLSPRVAGTIARETGATLLKLRAVHNVSREEMAAGATYISLMEENLKNLRTGLQCRSRY
jgi:zinc transport system substrate-binding protein